MDDFMNPPTEPTGNAYLNIEKDGRLWARCGWCGEKLFPVDDDTEIKHFRFKCKGSKCKRITEINII